MCTASLALHGFRSTEYRKGKHQRLSDFLRETLVGLGQCDARECDIRGVGGMERVELQAGLACRWVSFVDFIRSVVLFTQPFPTWRVERVRRARDCCCYLRQAAYHRHVPKRSLLTSLGPAWRPLRFSLVRWTMAQSPASIIARWCAVGSCKCIPSTFDGLGSRLLRNRSPAELDIG